MKYICKICKRPCILDTDVCCLNPTLCQYGHKSVSWEVFDRRDWTIHESVDASHDAYMVMGHSDYPLLVTTSMTTAKNRCKHHCSKSCDYKIKKTKMFYSDGQWYGPVHVVIPSEEEKKEDVKIEKCNQVIEHMKALGITDEEINLLKAIR